MPEDQARINFQQFMERCLISRALLEEYSYYLYRTDTNTVLERGVKGYEAAKQKATALRKKLGLKWDQIKFKSERSSGNRQFGVSSDGRTFTNAYGQRSRVEYAPRYNPSKGRRFRGYTDADGNYHDID
jgi:hypothetical protein